MAIFSLLMFVSLLAATARGLNVTCPDPPMDNDTYPLTTRHHDSDGYYFAARVNSYDSNFIDMQLSGKAEGWVAIGFSTTRKMSGNDVFGCKIDSKGGAYAIDTWNPIKLRATNVLDENQIGMCPHEVEYSNGRITCTFSRYIPVVNVGQDLDLNQSLYRIYTAVSENGGPYLEHLHYHSKTPSFSDEKSNILVDIENGKTDLLWPKHILLKVHGSLMVISWILLATSGVFFASWMKPVLPNGEWFQVHRGLMIGSLFVGAVGFAFAFIANAKGTTTPGLINFNTEGTSLPGILNFAKLNITHFTFGILVMLLQIANPLIALFRCKPDGQRRWIFTLLHGHVIGYASIVLALVNIGLGFTLLKSSFLIIYIVFAALLVVYQLNLFLMFTITAYARPDKKALLHSLFKYWYLFKKKSSVTEEYTEMKSEDEKAQLTTTTDSEGKAGPIKGKLFKFSWSVFVVQIAMTFVVVLVLISMIAISE